MAVGWCAKSSMMVMPLISAFTSRRRFTLRKVASAWAIASFEIPQSHASAAAAVAFQTLYSPPSANSKSAQRFPVAEHRPTRTLRLKLQVADSPIRAPRSAITLNRAKCLRQKTFKAGTAFTAAIAAAVEGNNPSPPRHQIHQTFKSRLHRIKIFVNIGMIKLN